jgi:hypothetical protein
MQIPKIVDLQWVRREENNCILKNEYYMGLPHKKDSPYVPHTKTMCPSNTQIFNNTSLAFTYIASIFF